jgi:hypothetical protein
MTTGFGKRSGPIFWPKDSGPHRSDKAPVANPPLICKLCFEKDRVATTSVVEHRCTNDRTGGVFTAFVCARCLRAGRETRVTCRTFISSETRTPG